jgi:hypothetical protein
MISRLLKIELRNLSSALIFKASKSCAHFSPLLYLSLPGFGTLLIHKNMPIELGWAAAVAIAAAVGSLFSGM